MANIPIMAPTASPRLAGVAALLTATLLAGCAADVDEGDTVRAEVSDGVSSHHDHAAPGCRPYIRTELFFGTTRTGGEPVSEAEFDRFLDAEITPRFPDGLTMLTGRGQFRRADGHLVEERSVLVVLLHPKDPGSGSDAKLDQIRELYEQRFDQESVLRSDSEPACVSF